ncbi:hypothetical protein [Wolbachia endosymbiont (group A) of Ischnus inquisitorius]|uniref:hypothetical protein n=1 Tax=Wolbachia endosymbiont (group A) of Ischnus inquisitorius TaxID=3077922 RepID=UPI003132EF3C
MVTSNNSSLLKDSQELTKTKGTIWKPLISVSLLSVFSFTAGQYLPYVIIAVSGSGAIAAVPLAIFAVSAVVALISVTYLVKLAISRDDNKKEAGLNGQEFGHTPSQEPQKFVCKNCTNLENKSNVPTPQSPPVTFGTQPNPSANMLQPPPPPLSSCASPPPPPMPTPEQLNQTSGAVPPPPPPMPTPEQLNQTSGAVPPPPPPMPTPEQLNQTSGAVPPPPPPMPTPEQLNQTSGAVPPPPPPMPTPEQLNQTSGAVPPPPPPMPTPEQLNQTSGAVPPPPPPMPTPEQLNQTSGAVPPPPPPMPTPEQLNQTSGAVPPPPPPQNSSTQQGSNDLLNSIKKAGGKPVMSKEQKKARDEKLKQNREKREKNSEGEQTDLRNALLAEIIGGFKLKSVNKNQQSPEKSTPKTECNIAVILARRVAMECSDSESESSSRGSGWSDEGEQEEVGPKQKMLTKHRKKSMPSNPQSFHKERNKSPDSGHVSGDDAKPEPTSPSHPAPEAGKPPITPKPAGLQTKPEAPPVKEESPVSSEMKDPSTLSVKNHIKKFGGEALRCQKENVVQRL